MSENKQDKLLLTVNDIAAMTGWGQTMIRAILNRKDNGFTVRCGRNLYAHKGLFLKHLEDCAKYGRKI